MRAGGNKGRVAILAGLLAVAAVVFSLSTVEPLQEHTRSAQLVSIQQLPDYAETCSPEESTGNDFNLIARSDESVFAMLRATSVYAASQQAAGTTTVDRPAVRNLLDKDPIYAAIAVDTRTNEVALVDSNTWSIRIFDRLDNTPANAARTEPRRVISGPETDIGFTSGVYIDPTNGEIFAIENDIGDSIAVFAHEANGDVPPVRRLNVTHRAHSMAVDEEAQVFYLTVQYPPQVAVYPKGASGDEKPLRLLEGESTRLSDSHGIAIDVKNKLMFVNNWGNISQHDGAGTGRFEPASITTYPLEANGDAAPLRVIQGPKTQLNWPGAMAIDPQTRDLYVANDIGQSILVFRETDQGDVAPSRVIKGNKTGLSYPIGLALDTKNKEIWVANLGNSSATAYSMTAEGNAPPLRTIRSAPAGKVSLRFGKTQALAYDSKREEILVPN